RLAVSREVAMVGGGRSAVRAPGWWPGALVLIGVAGWIAFAVWSFAAAARTDRDRAELAAHRAAVVAARTAHELLDRDDFAALLPERYRMKIVDGRLVVPEMLHHLDSADVEADFAESERLSSVARFLLREARSAEFEERDPETAAHRLEQLLAADIAPESREWVLLQLAQLEGRRDRIAAQRHWLDELESNLPVEGPRSAVVAAGCATLRLDRGEALPSWIGERWVSLPDYLATSIIAKLEARRDAGGEHPRNAALLAEWAEIRAHREDLAIGRAWARRGDLTQPYCGASSRRLIWYRPTATDGAESRGGEGVVVPIPRCLALFEEQFGESVDPRAWRWGDDADRAILAGEATPVVEGLAISPSTETGAGMGTLPLAPALASLCAVTVLGLFAWGRAVRRQREAITSRADFITAVTHELKTPIAAISLYAEMLGDDRVTEELRDSYTTRLSGECQRMMLIVDNILGVDPIERGARAYDIAPLSIGELVREIVDRYRPIAARDELELSTELTAAESSVLVDRNAFAHVLLNLLENVRRHALSGGTAWIRGAKAGAHYRLEVEDRGPGIPREDRRRIFEKFQRGAWTERSANPGVGLGLYICRAIVEDLAGSIACVDRVGGETGARFVVDLRLDSSGPSARNGE
ncbi:MAG: HAMP domain-containing histidine kinase, partial [Planctomycetes bacterium]|nr:HAMP domain-containing histidine kinase [Planctomycetota bacterium]